MLTHSSLFRFPRVSLVEIAIKDVSSPIIPFGSTRKTLCTHENAKDLSVQRSILLSLNHLIE